MGRRHPHREDENGSSSFNTPQRDFKQIKDFHGGPETLKLLSEREGGASEHIGIGKDFLN